MFYSLAINWNSIYSFLGNVLRSFTPQGCPFTPLSPYSFWFTPFLGLPLTFTPFHLVVKGFTPFLGGKWSLRLLYGVGGYLRPFLSPAQTYLRPFAEGWCFTPFWLGWTPITPFLPPPCYLRLFGEGVGKTHAIYAFLECSLIPSTSLSYMGRF